jgi:hypothetical protein
MDNIKINKNEEKDNHLSNKAQSQIIPIKHISQKFWTA